MCARQPCISGPFVGFWLHRFREEGFDAVRARDRKPDVALARQLQLEVQERATTMLEDRSACVLNLHSNSRPCSTV
jgi:hypothetical protein